MNFTALLASYAATLPAELPDKTILACLILSSRYRPRNVFIGAAVAFLAQVVIAVAAGGAISLLPHRWVYAATAAAFLVGALLLWRNKHEDEEEEGKRKGVPDTFWPVVATSFAVVFLAEFGDLTQLTTISLAARFHDPIGVGIGATLALWTAAGAATIVGWRLLRLINIKWLSRIAAIVMLALAATSAVAAATA
jgi:putative Ca2+/H+ antiporter (TMEM165/GDT1 family)